MVEVRKKRVSSVLDEHSVVLSLWRPDGLVVAAETVLWGGRCQKHRHWGRIGTDRDPRRDVKVRQMVAAFPSGPNYTLAGYPDVFRHR